jgi:hypothetical protein
MPPNHRVYVFSHPTKDATVIDATDGALLGKIDLCGVPEQGWKRTSFLSARTEVSFGVHSR